MKKVLITAVIIFVAMVAYHIPFVQFNLFPGRYVENNRLDFLNRYKPTVPLCMYNARTGEYLKESTAFNANTYQMEKRSADSDWISIVATNKYVRCFGCFEEYKLSNINVLPNTDNGWAFISEKSLSITKEQVGETPGKAKLLVANN